MRIRFLQLLICLSSIHYGIGQVFDDFSDGEFDNDPAWNGDISEFGVLNEKLNSSGPEATSELYLSTPSTIFNNTTWEFYIQIQGSAPSGSNKVRVFLMSDISNLEGAVNGYFLEIGQTGDDFLNLKRIVSGSGTTILSGTEVFDTQVRVKIERSAIGEWTLSTDHSGGTSYIEEGTTIDDTFQNTSYFGLVLNHTSSRNRDYFFDDFKVDQVEIDSLIVLDNLNLEVFFNQAINQIDAEDSDNYHISGLIISSTSQISSNHVEISLDSSTPLTTGIYTLTIQSNLTKNDPTGKEFGYLDLELQSLLTLSDTIIQLTFNDNLDPLTAENVTNYWIDNGIGQPVSATLDGLDKSIVNLTLANPLFENTAFQLSISALGNESQNSVLTTTENFTFAIPLVVDSAYLISETELVIEFNKVLEELLAETPANYMVNANVGNPDIAVLQPGLTSVVLTFSEAFETNDFTVIISNLEDTDGNIVDGGGSTSGFNYRSLEPVSITQTDETSVQVKFNQRLEISSAETLIHYTLTEIGNPSMATYHAADSSVTLTFDQLYNTIFYLTIDGVENELENALVNGNDSLEISIAVPSDYRSVMINEVFPDPTPVVGLPDAEYVELYNPAAFTLNLNGFLLNGELLPPYILGAGDYVVITDDANIGLFTELENIISVTSFDALTNSSDSVILRDQFGHLVDSIFYSTDWYRDTDKDDGGYALEQINSQVVCSDRSNWMASMDPNGGTPGTVNSVASSEPDIEGPLIESLEVITGDTLLISFNEPLSGTLMPEGLSVSSGEVIKIEALSYRDFRVMLNESLTSEQLQYLTVENISDCQGNISSEDSISFYYDVTAPIFKDLTIISDHEIALTFHEPLNESLSEKEENYFLDHGYGTPESAILQDSALYRVQLTFDSAFQVGQTYQISISSLTDTLGNTIDSLAVAFEFSDQIDSVYSTAPNLVYVQLTESPKSPVDKSSFIVSKEIGFPTIVEIDQDDSRIVRLGFENNLKPNTAYTLYVKDLISAETSEKLITPSMQLIYDTRAPRIENLLIPNDSQVVILWDEPIKLSSAFSSIQYELDGWGSPIDISAIDQQQIKLTFEFMIPGEEELDFKVFGVEDLYGNITGTIARQIIYDQDPPMVEKVVVFDQQTLLLFISETLDSASIFQPDQYSILGENPQEIKVIGLDSLSIQLQFSEIPVGIGQIISISGLMDKYGNQMDSMGIHFNSLNPIVSDIVFLSDSIVQLYFSKDMTSGIGETGKYQTNKTIASISYVSQNSVKILLAEGLLDKDSLFIDFLNLKDKEGNSLITENISVTYNSYFDRWKLIDPKTLELNFQTSFRSISSDQFLLQGRKPSLVQMDGDDQGIIRLGFSDSLTTDKEINLSIVNLTDIYERRIPDQEIPILIDKTPPQVVTIESDYFNQVHLTFNEPLTEASKSVNHFSIQTANILEISKPADHIIILQFDTLADFEEHQLIINGLSDIKGNVLYNDTIQFIYQTPYMPQSGDIMITELMVDPTPSVGLPEVEYVELLNVGEQVIQLKSLKLSDASKQISLPDHEITPGNFVVLSGETLENAIYVSGLPTFDNTSDSITVTNIKDEIIDQVVYSRDWYGDTEKDDGGYSLELINPESVCPGIFNWKASVSSNGGTPGAVNSVFSLDPDIEAPTLINYTLGDRSVTLTFSELLDSLSLETANYTIEGIGIESLVITKEYTDQVVINFTENPGNGQLYQLQVEGQKDCSGNPTEPFTIAFGHGKAPGFNEIIITEIMADPDPVMGLPNSEYLEIYNRTDELISLKDVRLKDATGEMELLGITLQSNQYIVLVPNGSMNQFKDFGEVIGVSGWRSLSNQGESLSLFHHQELIFNLEYSDSWYTEEVDGGVSLEMKDVNNPCSGANNWASSISDLGGTPGKVNSVEEAIPDNFGPDLEKIEVLSDTNLRLEFNEPLTLAEITPAQIEILPGPVSVQVINQEIFDRTFLDISLSEKIKPNVTYTLSMSQVKDCNNNIIGTNKLNFLLPEEADSLDVVICEVLFNPRSDGVDFVEIHNRSNKNIDLKGWKLGRQFEDVIASYLVTDISYILKPSEYLALTADPNRIMADYAQSKAERIFQMNSLVQYPNETAKIVLQNNQEQIIDAFEYHEDMHLSFLESVDGVSLERISMDKPTQDINNWQSASGTVGFATPGYENSQSLEPEAMGVLNIEPKVFIPANRGVAMMQDFTTINYQLSQPGKLANINIYNRNGQLIKNLANGITLATNGFFKWDGTTDIGSTATIGHYLIVFEVYDSQGEREIIKETVVVGQ